MALRGLLQVDIGHDRLNALKQAAAREGLKSAASLAHRKLAELGFIDWLNSLPAWCEPSGTPVPRRDE